MTEQRVSAERSQPSVAVMRGRRLPGRLRGIGSLGQRYALLVLLVAVFAFFSLLPQTSATFPTMANVDAVLADQAVETVIALGLLFPIISGYFDFSAGSVAAVSSVTCSAVMSRYSGPLILAIVASVILGCLIGLALGFLIAYVGMNQFIATLGAATLLGGIILGYTNGLQITSNISAELINFGASNWFGVPCVVVLVSVLVAGAWFLLTQTVYGRRLHAIGSNERAAVLVGMRTRQGVCIAFALAGSFAGIAGVILVSRNGGATADNGLDLLLPALTAVLLGTTVVKPGHYTVMGTIIGILFVAFSVSGITLLGASSWVQPTFNGGALMVAVALASILRRRTQSLGGNRHAADEEPM